HRRLGSLVIASERPGAYTEDEMGFFALAASQIALAMDDALNFQASRRAQERLALLLDLTNRVVSNLDLRDLLRTISASIRRVMRCDGVGVGLPDSNNKLQLYALDFPDGNGVIHESYQTPAAEETPADRVFRTAEALDLDAARHQDQPAV